MKIVYCTHSLYNPGGMERVLLNKVAYLRKHTDWHIIIVTTDQHHRPPFYPLPQGVHHIDLDINYSDDNHRHPPAKIAGYLRRRRLHRRRLTELLLRERPDITISLFPSESSFIPDIPDGSRKVLELHFCKFFRTQYRRLGLLGIIDRMRQKADERLVRRFDRFVVLTRQDRDYWGDTGNIEVIPNACATTDTTLSPLTQKRVIAVGRLDYQKGFDRLLQAWHIIQETGKFSDWHLDIFGQGEWLYRLKGYIRANNLTATATINPPTDRIQEEYTRSSIIAMSSHYEGLPMVLIEAMSHGVPAVAFDCQCGPRDIISHGINGLLARQDDVPELSRHLSALMDNYELRVRMGAEAMKVRERYSEHAVMQHWISLFRSLTYTTA